MVRKLVILIFISVFLLNACTYVMLPASTSVLASNGRLVLGSPGYIAKIQNISKKSGYRSALSEVMADVEKNGRDLDNNTPDNILRFHRLVSSLINKIGSVDMQIHYFRNKLNRAPGSLNELIRLNRTHLFNKRWILLGVMNSYYHIQGKDGEYNLKFISSDGFCEAVYNKQGVLLNEKNDPVNMGTFNYAAGIPGAKAHEKYDIAPYFIWGNTPDSPQKGSASIYKGVNTALKNYKAHAASVYLYRKNLFGMQQGRVT